MRLWIAQGFGVGRIPIAPGTFGSVVGLLWFGALIASRSPWVYALGTVTGAGFAVWLCGCAEKQLGQKDPGSVVLDEIAAIPLCFASYVGMQLWRTGVMPGVRDLIGGTQWIWTLGIFMAFRLFDVWKPWPVRQSQKLPGGWGITIDDLLAAVYVSLAVLAAGLARA